MLSDLDGANASILGNIKRVLGGSLLTGINNEQEYFDAYIDILMPDISSTSFDCIIKLFELEYTPLEVDSKVYQSCLDIKNKFTDTTNSPELAQSVSIAELLMYLALAAEFMTGECSDELLDLFLEHLEIYPEQRDETVHSICIDLQRHMLARDMFGFENVASDDNSFISQLGFHTHLYDIWYIFG